MIKPIITVLMPVFNGGDYLKTSIESVLAQTYKHFEFLIINDCSTDDTLQIVNSYNNERISLYSNERNLGQTASLNKGLELAKGKYVARLDADDIAFSHWLKKQVDYIEKHPEYVVVSTNAAIIDDSNSIRKVLKSPSSQSIITLRSLTRSPINHVGSIMRKEVILENGGYSADYKVAADYDLWSKLIQKGHKLTSIKDITVAIRVHAESISICESYGASFSETVDIIRKNISRFTNLNLGHETAISIWKIIYNVENLDYDDFREAQDTLRSIYENLKTDFQIDKHIIQRYLRKQWIAIYAKRIFAYLDKDDIKMARSTAVDYIRQYGAFNILSLFYILSCLGITITKAIPNLYEKALRLLANAKLRKYRLQIP